jgi:hypothetical protein
MLLRTLVVAAAMAVGASASGALASASDCVACYRHVVRPPVSRAVSERVVLHPGQTVARTVLPRYETVAERVLIAPARNVWQVTRGPRGEAIGCWVAVPAQYAVRHRSVMLRPAGIVTEAIPAASMTRVRSVVVDRGGPAWEPISVR